MQKLTAAAAFLAFLAVAMGAFGAHALKDILGDRITIWQTGSTYHLSHSLGMLLVSVLGERLNSKTAAITVMRLFFAGIILFAGSLYLLAYTNVKILGAITPFGGVCFLAGWLILAFNLYRNNSTVDTNAN